MPLALLVPVYLACAMGAPSVFPFDGSPASRSGLEPAIAEGLAFGEGREGECLYIGPGTRLAYPTQGVYDPARGTVNVWIRPRWNSRDLRGDRLVWSLSTDPGADNAVALGFYGDAQAQFAYFSNTAGVDGVIAPIAWQAGEWHSLAACWDQELRCRALYVDGVLAGVTHYGRDMPSQQTTFEIGYLRGTFRGVTDGCQAECDIDNLNVSTEAEAEGFAGAARAAYGQWEARGQVERDRARLAERFSLDRVAREHIEVTWDDLVGLGAPITKRVPIEARHHPDVVFVQPDLSVSLGTSDTSLGLGVGVGDPPRLPEVREPTLRLRDGYLPIVESEWRPGSLVVRQTAFCLLPDDDEVVTGREAQYLVMRLVVRNAGTAPSRADLAPMVGRMGGSQNTNYGPFLAPATRWQGAALDVHSDGRLLMLGDRALLSYRPDAGVSVSFRDGLTFSAMLEPGEERAIDLMAPTAPGLCSAEELLRVSEGSYDAALSRTVAYWNRPLARGMKLATPEPRLNEIYRHLILSSLAGTVKQPERPWHVPYQNLFATSMVWPWEFAHMAVPLISVGYAEDMRPSLAFFTERQNGVGQYPDPAGPDGDVLSTKGCYTGTSMYWMCETGAVLWVLAEEFLYSRDAEWLERQRGSILAAWDFIQRERARTRLRYDDGRKVEYYGLMPKGRVHDWEGRRYHFAFSDGYTWKGMSEVAAAFRLAGFPEAGRLARDADEYRQCILDAMRRAEFVDPKTHLPFVPNTVFYREGIRGGVWWADGPSALFAVDQLAPDDRHFEPMLRYLRREWGTLMGLMNHMEGPPDTPYWYVNATERTYYKEFLARDEFEKALLVFTSNLVYGLSHDCYQTVERIDLFESNYAPFQPNPSGNGRMIEMFKRMVVDEQDLRTLWLLRGCPRRWFGEGQTIDVSDAPTLFGSVAVRTRASQGQVVVEVTPPAIWPPDGVRVVVRNPERRPFRRVTVNGRPASIDGEAIHVARPAEALRIICIR